MNATGNSDLEDPIVSVDTKKRELEGNYRNAGMAWKQEAMHTLAIDFRSDAKGVAIPLGRPTKVGAGVDSKRTFGIAGYRVIVYNLARDSVVRRRSDC